MFARPPISAVPLLAAILVVATQVAAALALPPKAPGDATLPPDYVPQVLEKAREMAGIDERVGEQLPMDLELTDSAGRTVRLGDYFTGRRPVIIQLAYYRCPQLCGEISQGMIRSVRALAGELTIAEDFEVLTISFDSREKPALALSNKEATVTVLKRSWPEQNVREGWEFFVAGDASITRLTDALGYRFGWVEEAGQYSHPAAIVICTPDGKISRYLYNTSYEPLTMRLSLIGASEGTITPGLRDVFILSCFAYDPQTGKYTPIARRIMQAGGVLTVLTIISVISFMLIMERRGRLKRHPMAGMPAEEDAAEDEPEDDDPGAPPPPRTAFSG